MDPEQLMLEIRRRSEQPAVLVGEVFITAFYYHDVFGCHVCEWSDGLTATMSF